MNKIWAHQNNVRAISETEVKSLKTGVSLFHEKYDVFSGKIIARKSHNKRLYKLSRHQVGLKKKKKKRAHLLDHRKSKGMSE